MKLKVFLPLALLGLRTPFVVAQGLSYGYTTACRCTEIVTTTVYVPDACLPCQETTSAIGTAVNPSTSDSAVETTSTEFITATSTFPTATASETLTDTTTGLTSTLEITTTIEGPEESSTETPTSAKSTPTSFPLKTTTETQSSETESPSSQTSTFGESTSRVIETATATTEFPPLSTITSDIELSSSSTIETLMTTNTLSYTTFSEGPTDSTSFSEATPPSSDLSTFSISSTDISTTTAGGVIVTPTPSVTDLPTTSSSTETNSGEVPFSEPLTEAISSVASTSTNILLTVTTTDSLSTFTTISASYFNCTHHATLPLTTQTNEGQFTTTSLGAPITTEVSSLPYGVTSSYVDSSSFSNTSSVSTVPLTTATDAGQFITTSSLDLTTTSESSTFTPYSSGVTTVATITDSFSEGPTLTLPSPTEESSVSAPTDTFLSPTYPIYGYDTWAASHGDGGPTTLKKVRKGRYHAQ